jgi:hypothetical protein
MVSLSFDYTPGSSVDALPIEIFEHWKFLRVERSVKKLITPESNALTDDTIKACGCLKVWWDQGLSRGKHDVQEESRRQLQQFGGDEVAEYLDSGLIVHCRV